MKSHAVAMVVPVVELSRGHAERHAGEERKARMLVDEVVVSGVVHVCLTCGHSIKNLERADEFASSFNFDGQRTVCDGSDVVSSFLSRIKHASKATAPRRDHRQRALALCICWCCQGSRRSCGATKSRIS